MKNLLCATLLLLAGCHANVNLGYQPTNDPKKFVIQYVIVEQPYTDDQAFRKAHKSEILKTLIVNEVVELGDLRAIFYSYSVGADVLRNVKWASVVNGDLYSTFISQYSLDDDAEKYGVDENDLKDVLRKCMQWELKPALRWAE
ncbi:MAG: hypothetical protein K2G66_02145 [Alistipes sp.]|nr:hypothetical protein [Alistipes sp.]MDE5906420.1 hypothetical protein [Alistipes sp.]